MTNKTSSITPDAVLTLNNPVFCAYLASSTLLAIKILLMTLLTAYKRMKYKAWATPEDVNFQAGEMKTHDEVERVRSAHLNDLEVIPAFLASAFAYVFVHPNMIVACVLYFGFTLTRYAHTLIYAVFAIRQPARAIAFFTGYFVALYMAIHAAVNAFCHI